MRQNFNMLPKTGGSNRESEPRSNMTTKLFDPYDYIEVLEDGFALCNNPMVDGGLCAITVNTHLVGDTLKNFENSVKRMVLSKLFSPKFGEVILTATRLRIRD